MASPKAGATRWLIATTRPVLAPLIASTLFRHLYFIANLAILGFGAGVIARLARDLHEGRASGAPLWASAAVLIVCTLLKALFSYLEHFLGHLVAFKALEILRVEFYRAMVPQAVDQRRESGDLLTRATKDIDRIEVFFAHTFAPAVTAVTLPVIGVIVAVVQVSAWPALVAGAGLAIATLPVPLFGARASLAGARRMNEARGRIAHHVTDSLQGIAEVTGYGRVPDRLDAMTDLDLELGAEQSARGRLGALRDAAGELVSLATLLATVITGAATGAPAVPLVVWTAVTWGLFDAAAGVRGFAGSLDASLAAAARVYSIVEGAGRTPDRPESLPSGGLEVDVEDASYTYPSEGLVREPAVIRVSARVRAGSHLCVMGESGSGKTTLLKLIAWQIEPSSGDIRVGGRKTWRIDAREYRGRVLLVEQQAVLFNATVRENLRLAVPEAADEEMNAALDAVRLLPELGERGGLDLDVGESAKLLSGGQRQRLALARAILLRPDVLLLDEYTSHLDPETTRAVRRGLREALPETTIVESTHDATSLEFADHVLVLDKGRVIASGRPGDALIGEALGTGAFDAPPAVPRSFRLREGAFEDCP